MTQQSEHKLNKLASMEQVTTHKNNVKEPKLSYNLKQ